ncbi:MAG TPA: DNA methyltransferase [Spirochaetota bacterium]|nr:DNA methyltransferase [Spirochaetota bacterium]HOM86691.1 DNA methyltransferase [Spirochaetota bacterium]HOR93168.1 DNA methyltransferase [Spirochaetota bacterium]
MNKDKLLDKSINLSCNNCIQKNNTLYEDSWDFKNANTKEYTHCFHSYPAMMIPQVARRIIEIYGENATLLFDPYCGTGTSLVEANLKGINAIGTDLNPLARLIAQAKTTKIDSKVLDKYLYDFTNYLFSKSFKEEDYSTITLPCITNIDIWFSKSVQYKLAIIFNYIIQKIDNVFIQNFFKVAFSETIRETSNTKNGEFKLVRDKKLIKTEDLDVFGIILGKLSRNKEGLINFIKVCPQNVVSHIYSFDTVLSIPYDLVPQESVDIVVTSPPYGDSRTTVAYGQFSRFANEWLGFHNANKIDNLLMGGRKNNVNNFKFNNDLLNDVITAISNKDNKRAMEVVSFFKDYESSIVNVSATIKKGGVVCYVVGNRTVKNINIPTNKITAQLFEQNNFVHMETIVRNIPNKRMPLMNSPTNVPGQTGQTMKNEYIVICKKI